MISMNEVMILGRIGAKPEMRNTPKGQPLATFSVCVNEKSKDGQEIKNWLNCEVWGNLATIMERIAPAAGQEIFIKGKIRNTSWNDAQGKPHNRTSIVVMDFKTFPIQQPQTASHNEPGYIQG